MPLDHAIRNVLVIGSGPVVIGQAAEFDYSGSQACLVIRENGLSVTLLNLKYGISILIIMFCFAKQA